MSLEIVSWNVNGIRSAAKQGFLKWLSEESPDIVCLQETKAHTDDLDQLLKEPFGYQSYWLSAEKKGYSGVAVYSKIKPQDVSFGVGKKEFDSEGRIISIDYGSFILVNTYFPNSQRDHARLGFKLSFCNSMLEYLEKLRRAKKNIVICGDFNIAHKEIDLKNPHSNRNNAGFLPEERAWMDQFIKTGYVDTFREFCKDPDQYSWWSYRPGVRERNIGWRLDYHFVNQEFRPRLKSAKIHPHVFGSDHCPVSVELTT